MQQRLGLGPVCLSAALPTCSEPSMPGTTPTCVSSIVYHVILLSIVWLIRVMCTQHYTAQCGDGIPGIEPTVSKISPSTQFNTCQGQAAGGGLSRLRAVPPAACGAIDSRK
jgi:hypothetical protein